MEKKRNIFSRIKRWWKEDLTSYDRDQLKCIGLAGMEGAIIGGVFVSAFKAHKQQKIEQKLLVEGYLQGKLDAYKEIAQEPFLQMNAGMKKLEQQNKVTKF